MRRSPQAFTLTELLVSVAVLVGLVLLISRLFISASAVTTSGNKRMDAELQVRALFERIAIDLCQIIKRPDVDYYFKSATNTQPGNDQMAFYSTVPGYYPSIGSQSPVSVVSYRINSIMGSTSFRKLERMAKGLLWNGVSTTDMPILFAPVPLSSPSSLPSPSGTPAFPTAGNRAPDSDYELIGPYVFRFEYFYLLKNGTLSETPWDPNAGHSAVDGMQDIAAIAVCVAAIDPKSRILLDNSSQVASPDDNITKLTGKLIDFMPGLQAGELSGKWRAILENNITPDPEITAMPRPAISAIRIYERYFYLLPKL